MGIDDKTLDDIYNELTIVLERLKYINDITGTSVRVNAMKDEIQALGWQGIYNKYHPDINCDDPASKELFAMYKYLYETMKNNGEII